MNDISKDKDYQEFFAGIKELAIIIMELRKNDYLCPYIKICTEYERH